MMENYLDNNCTALTVYLFLSLPQVAILIPFRNRHEHLPILFQHLAPMLQRQRLQFAFYVIEQVCRHRISTLVFKPRHIYTHVHIYSHVKK